MPRDGSSEQNDKTEHGNSRIAFLCRHTCWLEHQTLHWFNSRWQSPSIQYMQNGSGISMGLPSSNVILSPLLTFMPKSSCTNAMYSSCLPENDYCSASNNRLLFFSQWAQLPIIFGFVHFNLFETPLCKRKESKIHTKKEGKNPPNSNAHIHKQTTSSHLMLLLHIICFLLVFR